MNIFKTKSFTQKKDDNVRSEIKEGHEPLHNLQVGFGKERSV